MIHNESKQKEWIESISKSKKADKILVEKVIRALLLLEGLAQSELDFCFKGGTALMLLLGSTNRLSIDIDIIVPDKDKKIEEILAKVCEEKGFLRYEKNERTSATGIVKEHYKLFFESAVEGKESFVLLDVLREDIHYKTMADLLVSSSFVKEEGEAVKVKVPDHNNILADKLTAFAPNTTGIPYTKGEKEMGMEIIKQLYDIGCLCEHATNTTEISEVFRAFAKVELAYRNNASSIDDVLNDIFENAISICLRADYENGKFENLSKGIIQVKSFIFSENFHIEKAVGHAAKAAYLTMLIKHGGTEIKKFNKSTDMTKWSIESPTNKLNKLKKSNPEAFFYLYHMSELIKSNTDDKAETA